MLRVLTLLLALLALVRGLPLPSLASLEALVSLDALALYQGVIRILMIILGGVLVRTRGREAILHDLLVLAPAVKLVRFLFLAVALAVVAVAASVRPKVLSVALHCVIVFVIRIVVLCLLEFVENMLGPALLDSSGAAVRVLYVVVLLVAILGGEVVIHEIVSLRRVQDT